MQHISEQRKHLLKKIGSLCLSLWLFLSIFSISVPAWAMGTTPDDELLKIDPYFPTTPSDVPYTLSVPTLENRLTVSADGKTATLFAPYVTAQSGWYDTNKNFQNDVALCWAASTSDLIAWYLDVCDRTGANSTQGYERNVHRIFDKFRAAWDPNEGYSMMQGCAWYFTGHTLSGGAPENLWKPESGGYLNGIEHNTIPWAILDPVNHYPIVGSYEDKFPFIEDESGVYAPGAPFYNHENFSKTIIRQLHYGATSLAVIKQNGNAGGGHAITLWGCSYDIETGRVSKIYVTDSDDEGYRPGAWLKEITVKAASPDAQGIWLEGYTLPGDATPFRKVISSTLLYAPGVVKVAGDKDAYIDAPAVISAVEKRGNEAVVTASISKPGEQLEYGYSKENRISSVTNWQTENHFPMPTENEVYFFARAKETAAHKAGGVSNPYLFALREKPTKLPECPKAYKPYLDGIASRHPNWQFEFYDMGITFDEALALEDSVQKNRLDRSFPLSYRVGSAQADGTFAVNKEALAYYLDPRNAMTDQRLFSFFALAGEKELDDTYYFKKFTLSETMPRNVQTDSVYKEAQTLYNAMKSVAGNLERAHVFRIPVYRDMPSVRHLPDFAAGDYYQNRYGDVVADGVYTLADYQTILELSAQYSYIAKDGEALIAADLNGDTAVDAFDAALLDRLLTDTNS